MTDYEKRRSLLEQLRELKASHDAKLNALSNDDSLSDEAYDALFAEEMRLYDSQTWPIYWQAFALQFPKRRGWFADVFVPSFGLCDGRPLSAKQADVFRERCVSDDATWKTGNTYCRVGNLLITLTSPRYGRTSYLTIREL